MAFFNMLEAKFLLLVFSHAFLVNKLDTVVTTSTC